MSGPLFGGEVVGAVAPKSRARGGSARAKKEAGAERLRVGGLQVTASPSASSPRGLGEDDSEGRRGEGEAEVSTGSRRGPELPAGWRRVGACPYLPGGITVARRTAYDGRWQALQWVGQVAELVCEGASEDEVLRLVRDLGGL